MKLKCPFCGKTCDFEYWETEKVYLEYPIDEEGYVFYADGAMKQEYPGDMLNRYLQCAKCGACFSAKKEHCDKKGADLKVSLGRMTQKGFLPEKAVEDNDGS